MLHFWFAAKKEGWIAVLDMPNLNRFDILLILIFRKISENIDIDRKSLRNIDIDKGIIKINQKLVQTLCKIGPSFDHFCLFSAHFCVFFP